MTRSNDLIGDVARAYGHLAESVRQFIIANFGYPVKGMAELEEHMLYAEKIYVGAFGREAPSITGYSNKGNSLIACGEVFFSDGTRALYGPPSRPDDPSIFTVMGYTDEFTERRIQLARLFLKKEGIKV